MGGTSVRLVRMIVLPELVVVVVVVVVVAEAAVDISAKVDTPAVVAVVVQADVVDGCCLHIVVVRDERSA